MKLSLFCCQFSNIHYKVSYTLSPHDILGKKNNKSFSNLNEQKIYSLVHALTISLQEV